MGAWLRLELGKDFFKNPVMGTPDSQQCLFGAHRIAHSSCPMNHRTTGVQKEICARQAGALDSAHCSVR
jgi:hypothetical protein